MIKKCIFAIAALIASIANAGDSERIYFVGYDGKTPVFASRKYDGIYKYANGHLEKMKISHAKSERLLLVKDSIYVFSECLADSSTMFKFKLNRENIISELIFGLKMCNDDDIELAMNGEDFFVLVQRKRINDATVILKTKYKVKAKIDTIVNIKEYCNALLGATDDYLYYAIQDPESVGPQGNTYQVNLKSGISKVILEETATISKDEMMIVPDQNLIYDQVLFNARFHLLLVDYGKKLYAISPRDTNNNPYGVFYSYEHNAFVFSKNSLDVNKWQALFIDEVAEWKPLRNSVEIPGAGKPAGPLLVPFKK
jgi:hypothetical protein